MYLLVVIDRFAIPDNLDIPENRHKYTKKRDCNLAVPLLEALVLPFVPNSNTEAHAVCISLIRYAICAHDVYTHHGHLSVAMFWNSEFTRFQEAKTKRLRRLFQYVLYVTHPKDIYPQRGLNTAKLSFCAAKVQLFFDICKKNVYFFLKKKKSALAEYGFIV